MYRIHACIHTVDGPDRETSRWLVRCWSDGRRVVKECAGPRTRKVDEHPTSVQVYRHAYLAWTLRVEQ